MVDKDEARRALQEVESTRLRSEEFRGYWYAGVFAQIWGAIYAITYLANFLVPGWTNLEWLIASGVGCTATIVQIVRNPTPTRGLDRRILASYGVVMAFGFIASTLLMDRPGTVSVFWVLLMMTGYILIGIWAGKRWVILGCSVIAVVMVAYFFLLQWFALVMAACAGGGLFIGGTWMRRAK